MKKKCLFFIISLILFTFFTGCNRDYSEKDYRKSHFKRLRDKHHRDVSRFGFGRIEKMAEELNLSEDQIEKLKEIDEEMREKRTEMRQEKSSREDIKIKMVELIRKNSLSREEVLSFMDELHSLKEEHRLKMDSLMAERLAKIHSILTEEQREILAKRIEEFKPAEKLNPRKDIK